MAGFRRGAPPPWERGQVTPKSVAKARESALSSADETFRRKDVQIETDDVADDAITGPKIPDSEIDTNHLADNAVDGDKLATDIDASAVTMTGAVIQTADTGERVVMRNDGSGGIIEFFGGLSGETAGYVDPTLFASIPALTFAPGKTASFPSRPLMRLAATDDAASDAGGTFSVAANQVTLSTGATHATIALGDVNISIGATSTIFGDLGIGGGNVEIQGHLTVAGTGWLRPGDTGGPTWGTSWTDFDSTNDERVAMKRVGTTVKVRGAAKRTAGSSTTIITLPSGCRPNRILLRPAWVNGPGIVSVDTSGNVVVNSTYANSQALGFEIEFDTDQP